MLEMRSRGMTGKESPTELLQEVLHDNEQWDTDNESALERLNALLIAIEYTGTWPLDLDPSGYGEGDPE
jgi:hypothetical protein